MTDQPPETPVADSPQAVGGTPFGRYRLIELLGRGGMGDVWRAFDTATERVVAVKVLPEHLSHDEKFQQRFRREARAAASLNSPHVVPIHNHGEIDGRLYVDMRLVEGRDLQTVLADGSLEPGRAVRIIEQVARALHAAHKVGLVHRDVKPSNILLDEDDYAYLIDFGIARSTGEAGLTGTSTFIGSWHYMAPERFSAKEADARADVYALACVLYECLTGSRLYPGESLEQQYVGHVVTPPPRPSATNPNLSRQFDSVTDKGLAKEPNQRYATTVELARAAREASTDPVARSAPPVQHSKPAAAPVAQRPPEQGWQQPPPRMPTVPSSAMQRPPDWAASQRRVPTARPMPVNPKANEFPTRYAYPGAPHKASKPASSGSREILALEILLGSVSLVFLSLFTGFAVHDTTGSGSDRSLLGDATYAIVIVWWAAMIAVVFDVVRRIRQQRRNVGR